MCHTNKRRRCRSRRPDHTFFAPADVIVPADRQLSSTKTTTRPDGQLAYMRGKTNGQRQRQRRRKGEKKKKEKKKKTPR